MAGFKGESLRHLRCSGEGELMATFHGLSGLQATLCTLCLVSFVCVLLLITNGYLETTTLLSMWIDKELIDGRSVCVSCEEYLGKH